MGTGVASSLLALEVGWSDWPNKGAFNGDSGSLSQELILVRAAGRSLEEAWKTARSLDSHHSHCGISELSVEGMCCGLGKRASLLSQSPGGSGAACGCV